MSEILVVYAHPNPRRSRLNGRLARAAGTVPGVEVHDLYEAYPNFHIDVEAEQKALTAADVVVFQFPIYWFNAPALLKEWQDSVLTKGFAFGPDGNCLEGKPMLLAVSTGGAQASYAQEKAHGDQLSAYLTPFEQTARFCGMTPLEPFVTYDVGSLSERDCDRQVVAYCSRLRQIRQESH